MNKLLFVTGNETKFLLAQHACEARGVELEQVSVDIDEIQGSDPAAIALDKARKAYGAIGKPLVVSDDSWSIPGLGGFPGAYMHEINEWFNAEDFLRLTLPLDDRRVYLIQMLVFIDGNDEQVFEHRIEGELLKEIRGESSYPNHTITTFPGEGGLSLAEINEKTDNHSKRDANTVWYKLLDKLQNKA